MILFVHAAPATLEAHAHPNLGVLSSPRRWYRDADGLTWAADNDAYSKWDAGRYQAMLEGISGMDGCKFVTAPDVVADADETLCRYWQWKAALDACGQPVALVAQDGLRGALVPWDELGGLFVGGSTEWKMGDDAAALVQEARKRGLWVHMGRVNSLRRLTYAKAIGCHSVDGTSLSWFRNTYLPQRLRDAAAPRQTMLGLDTL